MGQCGKKSYRLNVTSPANHKLKSAVGSRLVAAIKELPTYEEERASVERLIRPDGNCAYALLEISAPAGLEIWAVRSGVDALNPRPKECIRSHFGFEEDNDAAITLHFPDLENVTETEYYVIVSSNRHG
ncbi:unnamed protein product [Protopolystoma xenopodis]|uniref:Uncharacterized protein n=1 Tax=Protopolystoma xenopodis TaxID=117903 RepID=A0A3S5CV86_9PLAT|nr:unnamed protein product [Protopolystoma xenopodis]